MSYTLSKLLSFDEFLGKYCRNPRYELANGELIDMEPTGPHETVSGKLLGIPEYWIVDYRGLGGIAFIGKPKQPTFTVCQLNAEVYSQQQYRLGQPITSPLLPQIQLRLDDVLPR
ncbi:Uma2 family endonuclease [Pseudanabaena sp. PCC 6802]|uniref:Uma2 family endonuclease n=1 Tax=Pseudanabaena sp. PCC 6802 TaxID=118173 RepID=UPI00037BEA6B|nr:Uma2 family endonuclease [Pseudanabaena sp. PCC 6802]